MPALESRLQTRYLQLVMEHLSPAQQLAAGLRSLPGPAQPFAATQAAWRFYGNRRIDLPRLAGPLIEQARAAATEACDRHLLMVLDWSALHYPTHTGKADRIKVTSYKDFGYHLLTALAVSDRDGSPLAPVCLELEAADGLHSTRSPTPTDVRSALDQLDPVMRHVQQQNLGRPLVWIIDREADSVGHFRQWISQKRRLLIRADDQRRVLHEGVERTLASVADDVRPRFDRPVQFKGQAARQFVGETTVRLHRPARQHRVGPDGKARHRNIPGEPVVMRLVVSQVRDAAGRVLARWLLLSNLPADVSASTLALWYYWRWRIECYHKLLKSAGQQVEHWQQESAAALVRRLTVSAMAAVVVWHLARDERPQAAQMRQVLVRLSGRQIKRGKGRRPFTEPALLAGLGVLVPMLQLLEEYDLADLRRLANQTLPRLRCEGG